MAGVSWPLGRFARFRDKLRSLPRPAREGRLTPHEPGDSIPAMLSPGMPAEEIVEHYGEDLAVRIIVTGGRHYSDARAVAKALTAYQAKHPGPHTLVHGGADGADTMAAAVAYTLGWDVEKHPADWELHGKHAGPIRNRKMANSGADGLIAFPGGRGTANMIECAKAVGIPVWEPAHP